MRLASVPFRSCEEFGIGRVAEDKMVGPLNAAPPYYAFGSGLALELGQLGEDCVGLRQRALVELGVPDHAFLVDDE